jgi:hypothetical protein
MLVESISNRKNLSETELHMVAEVAIEMARAVAGPSSAHAGAQTLARAALKDAAFKADLAALHQNVIRRRKIDPRHMLAPLAPLFHKLELEANKVLSRSVADATFVAARRADELLEVGDMDGCAIWERILAAVAELARATPAEGERINEGRDLRVDDPSRPMERARGSGHRLSVSQSSSISAKLRLARANLRPG